MQQDLDSLNHGLKSCDQSHITMETAVWDRTSIRHALEQHRVSTVNGQLFKLKTENKEIKKKSIYHVCNLSVN